MPTLSRREFIRTATVAATMGTGAARHTASVGGPAPATSSAEPTGLPHLAGESRPWPRILAYDTENALVREQLGSLPAAFTRHIPIAEEVTLHHREGRSRSCARQYRNSGSKPRLAATRTTSGSQCSTHRSRRDRDLRSFGSRSTGGSKRVSRGRKS